MSNNTVIRELKLHSPAGVEPAVFVWPNVEQQVDRLRRIFRSIQFDSTFRKLKKVPYLSVVMKSFELFV